MGDPTDQRWERQARSRRVVRDAADIGRSIAKDVRQRFPERQWVRGIVADAELGEEEATFALATQLPDGTVASRLPVVLGEWAYAQVRRELEAGGLALHHVIAERQPVVVAGRLAYRDEDNHLELRMDGFDMAGTNELLASATEATRAALREEGMYDRQRRLDLPGAPIRVGIVAEEGSAALAEVEKAMTEGDFRTRYARFPAPMEGNRAAAALAGAITDAARDCDWVIVARDPAPRASLTAFDSEPVARAVSVAAAPVVTAVGTAEAPTLADEVAYRACASPASAARVVLEVLRESLLHLERQEARLRKSAYGSLGKARAEHDARAEALERTKAGAGERVKAARARVRNGLLITAAAAVVLLVVLYVAIAPPVWVPILVVAVALAAGLVVAWPLVRGWMRKRKETGVELEGMTFAEALAALDGLRERLEEATQPEDIERLMFEADEVSRYCRSLLGNAGEAIAAHERT